MPYSSQVDAPVSGIVFDFDGTLTEPDGLDFGAVRRRIGCPPALPILEFLETLPEDQRLSANAVLDEMEFEAAVHARPAAGVAELLAFLDAHGLPFAIVTRNSLRSLTRSLENFPPGSIPDEVPLITRDDDLAPKPDAAPILEACRRLGRSPVEVLTVGDFRFDIEAGANAGTRTVYLNHGRPSDSAGPFPTYIVGTLSELLELVNRLRPLPVGKLPNEMLAAVLEALPPATSDLLIGPAVGEDFAAVCGPGDERVIVLKADPVTFTESDAARLVVTVNANDVATSGARPRWFLATVLCPVGANFERLAGFLSELIAELDKVGMALCGGHTEITDAVTRIVVSGCAIGTVSPSRLVRKSAIAPGDSIVMTKAVPIEGASIAARAFGELLAARGVSEAEVERCAALGDSPGVGVVEEALVAAGFPSVSALHDVTEGGIATALQELSTRCGLGFRVDPDRILVHPDAVPILEALGISPLGTIGSGCLLVVVRPEGVRPLIDALARESITAAEIGSVLDATPGVTTPEGSPGWPHFERDELARIIEGLS